jgi:hypothetical protein
MKDIVTVHQFEFREKHSTIEQDHSLTGALENIYNKFP